MANFNFFIIVFVAVLAIIFCKYLFVAEDDRESLILIGIISSRENILQRETLRKTWLNGMLDVKYYFVIGNDYCEIPIEDRISTYNCEYWNVSLPHDFSSEVTSSVLKLPKQIITTELKFRIHHNIIIKKICIMKKFVPQRDILKISLLDEAAGSLVFSVTFSDEISTNDSETFSCKNVETFLLPKYFEAKLTLTLSNKFQFNESCALRISDITKIILYEEDNSCFPAFFVYSVTDLNSLMEHVNTRKARFTTWKTEQSKIDLQLRDEFTKHNDILFLNVKDFYQNLPLKLLIFLKWVDENEKFKYLLKTDDDTLINLSAVKNKIIQGNIPDKNIIWSSFRTMWSVERVGKWKEKNYKSVTYPPFPCGSGYVLSRDVVKLLSNNFKNLRLYQGEDVSIGIWLAAFNVNLIDSCWQCDFQDKNFNSCNFPQLSTEQHMHLWKEYLNSIQNDQR